MANSPKRPSRQAGLADALFGHSEQRVLGVLFGQPDRSFFSTELIALARSGSGATQRVLRRLEQSGLVTVQRIGTQKHYRANADSPIFEELRAIVRKTFGIAEPLRSALMPLAHSISGAFVYGSVAKREDTAASDIDLMIVGDATDYPELYATLEAVGQQLGRKVNPTVYTRARFAEALREGNAFVTRVMQQPKLWILGSDDALAA
jgi:predicted nucleotidyltransferase